jgi:Uma2 family endonuclease
MPVQTVISSKLAEFDNLPEGPPYYELIRNQIIEMPPPTTFHQSIGGKIHLFIGMYLLKYPIGRLYYAPVNILLDEFNVLQPDLLFVSNERLSIITEKRIEGAPDWVCEILSPSTRKNDLTVKKELYQAHGVKEYWIVDPDIRTVEVLSNKDSVFVSYGVVQGNIAVASSIFTGLNLTAEAIFSRE